MSCAHFSFHSHTWNLKLFSFLFFFFFQWIPNSTCINAFKWMSALLGFTHSRIQSLTPTFFGCVSPARSVRKPNELIWRTGFISESYFEFLLKWRIPFSECAILPLVELEPLKIHSKTNRSDQLVLTNGKRSKIQCTCNSGVLILYAVHYPCNWTGLMTLRPKFDRCIRQAPMIWNNVFF